MGRSKAGMRECGSRFGDAERPRERLLPEAVRIPAFPHYRTPALRPAGIPYAGVWTPGIHRSSSGNANAETGSAYRFRHAFMRTCQMSCSIRLLSRAKRTVVG